MSGAAGAGDPRVRLRIGDEAKIRRDAHPSEHPGARVIVEDVFASDVESGRRYRIRYVGGLEGHPPTDERPWYGTEAVVSEALILPWAWGGYVVTQPCIDVKDGACVNVCPVDCIHTDADARQYFIDPDVCLICGACVTACTVDAIFYEADVPDEWSEFIGRNAAFFDGK